MKPKCPSCGNALPLSDVDIAQDVALCRKCGHLSKASALVDHTFDVTALRNPPAGAWMRPTMNGVAIGATTRSAAAFFLVPFMLVWSGGSLGGIYGTQIRSGEFNLVLSLFGIPFVLGSILFWGIALMAIWGKVEVRLRGGIGTALVGIGRIGWKRTFQLNQVTNITEELRTGNRRGGVAHTIVLHGPKSIRFGSGLSPDRRRFMIQALRAAQA
ncbi:hypothetical protein [Synoicihabitans lomoniglobus]|uniref:Uncharacterized protein n=1 Tax=Synoicihabitans lomoniglobus TaxID=2909285 RepID=A0AAE9ZVJ4_9BACT|nr:hypothetical protein [Opitutaceae bacterium LMO-M01]WED63869.1 hypothetical protein PXH66_16140 [Opitutaceae bacterium LMO-M01]